MSKSNWKSRSRFSRSGRTCRSKSRPSSSQSRSFIASPHLRVASGSNAKTQRWTGSQVAVAVIVTSFSTPSRRSRSRTRSPGSTSASFRAASLVVLRLPSTDTRTSPSSRTSSAGGDSSWTLGSVVNVWIRCPSSNAKPRKQRPDEQRSCRIPRSPSGRNPAGQSLSCARTGAASARASAVIPIVLPIMSSSSYRPYRSPSKAHRGTFAVPSRLGDRVQDAARLRVVRAQPDELVGSPLERG